MDVGGRGSLELGGRTTAVTHNQAEHPCRGLLGTGDVDECAGFGYRHVSCASPGSANAGEHRYWRTSDCETRCIKRDREDGPGNGVQQMTSGKIPGGRPALDQHPASVIGEGLRDDLGVPDIFIVTFGHREEYGSVAWQHLWRDYPFVRPDAHETLWHAAIGGHTQDSRLSSDQDASRAPGCVINSLHWQCGHRGGCTTTDREALQLRRYLR